jgi:hypothetical protein
VNYRGFIYGDLVYIDHKPNHVGVVVNERPELLEVWVHFPEQAEGEYTVCSKNYVLFSMAPLDRLANGV